MPTDRQLLQAVCDAAPSDLTAVGYPLHFAVRDARLALASPRPKIVCLCGSTRFYDQFQKANYRLTMDGIIVLSVGHYPHSPGQAHGESVGCTPERKLALDELHKRKIDLADEVLVLNVKTPTCLRCRRPAERVKPFPNTSICCGEDIVELPYIGDSTRSEIEYAKSRGVPVSYLEPTLAPPPAGSVTNPAPSTPGG